MLSLIVILVMGACDDMEETETDAEAVSQDEQTEEVVEAEDVDEVSEETTEEDAEAEEETEKVEDADEVAEETTEEDSNDHSDETLEQQNAVSTAQDYLNYTSFSKSGLIEQLEFEGFSNEDATMQLIKLTSTGKSKRYYQLKIT